MELPGSVMLRYDNPHMFDIGGVDKSTDETRGGEITFAEGFLHIDMLRKAR